MTLDEYNKRFVESQKITGRGLDVTMHLPCPFCACPDFMVYKILEMEQVCKNEAICVECGRGAKMLFTYSGGHAIGLEVVQTRGEEQPDFLPKIRRV